MRCVDLNVRVFENESEPPPWARVDDTSNSDLDAIHARDKEISLIVCVCTSILNK